MITPVARQGERQRRMTQTGALLMLLTAASLDGGCQCTGAAWLSAEDGPTPDAAVDTRPNIPHDSSVAGLNGATKIGDAPVVIAAAGDIACATCAQRATADLLDGLVSSQGLAGLLALGDEAYASGSLPEFEMFYRSTWGRSELLAITHPVPGNHEYADGAARGYFDFFDGPGNSDGIAGPRGSGYYSFDIAGWHLIALNTSDQCRWVSCEAGSAQHRWLLADLSAHAARCTLAFWHHPRFQAGTTSGEEAAVAPLWDALFDAGADVVLAAHEHGYQQLAPLDKSGLVDHERGIRSFVVGTGGGDFDTSFGGPRVDALETKIVGTHGVLQLTLRPTDYDWRFITVGNTAPTAFGTAACH
jgi:hypothetical protein